MVRLVYALMVGIPVPGAAAGQPVVPEVTVTAPKPPEAQQLSGKSVPNFIKKHGKPAVRFSLQRTDIQNKMMQEFQKSSAE